MVAAAIVVVIVAVVAVEQTLRIAWEDSGPWRRGRFVVYAVLLLMAVGLAA